MIGSVAAIQMSRSRITRSNSINENNFVIEVYRGTYKRCIGRTKKSSSLRREKNRNRQISWSGKLSKPVAIESREGFVAGLSQPDPQSEWALSCGSLQCWHGPRHGGP